jgi:hypothetical protein
LKNTINTVFPDDRWLKASVVGGVWGSFEIITGSFLHNLKVPFSGTIMAFFSILLMSAFLQHWPQKGMIWRAGLIAALLKSLSPSAFLLGPMTGIFLEALFMELSVSLFGINLFSCILGGGISLLSALIHKLANLLLLYGNDFITIYENIFSFAFKQFSEAGISIRHVIVGLAFLYVAAGMLSALIGYFMGRKITHSIGTGLTDVLPEFSKKGRDIISPGNRSVIFLIAHMFIIPLLMLVNYNAVWYFALLLISLYVGLLSTIYPVVLNRIARPILWLQLIFMLILSILFLNSYTPGSGFDFVGMEAGLRMNLRALLVIAGFAAIGFELRNEKIKNVLLTFLNPKFYNSLKISFNLLPEFMSYLNSPGKVFRHPFSSIKGMLLTAENHLKKIQNQDYN